MNIIKGLRALYDIFEGQCRCLGAMQQDTNQDVFVSMLTSKISKGILLHLQIQKHAKEN